MSTRNGIGTIVRMRLMTALISLIFTFFVAPAFAGTTTLSSTLVSVPNTAAIECNFVNVSSKALDVTVSVVDISNTVLASIVVVGIPSQKGNILPLLPTISTVSRCVFAFSGSSKSLRAALEVTDLTGVPLVTLPAT